jgi:hypothetical protein
VRRAISRSFSVMPPAEWVHHSTATRPHSTVRRGWWFSLSASSPTLWAKARASRKFLKAKAL